MTRQPKVVSSSVRLRQPFVFVVYYKKAVVKTTVSTLHKLKKKKNLLKRPDVCISGYPICLFRFFIKRVTPIIVIVPSLSVRTRHEIWSMLKFSGTAKAVANKKGRKHDKNMIVSGARTIAKCCMSVVTAAKLIVLPGKTKAAVPTKIRTNAKKTVPPTKPTEVHHRVINISNKKIIFCYGTV